MTDADPSRPDPDALLRSLKEAESHQQRGRLKIFFGMCAGVGKTYQMLESARTQREKWTDVVIGIVETHGRIETQELVEGFEIIPRRVLEYRGTTLEEMDLDAIIARRPKLVLVDELAHTNAPGSRHAKRYQDVIEILEHGIDVFTTLNVQHLESRADTVAEITGAIVRETVPDPVFEEAWEVELVDIPAEELLKRLEEGKVYAPDRSRQALQSFFRKGNVTALREMALRLTAERVDHQVRDFMRTHRIAVPWRSVQRFVVGISPGTRSINLVRWSRRLAYSTNATWIAVYVETHGRLSEPASKRLTAALELARELGAEVMTTADVDVAAGLLRIAREQSASQILIGRPSRRAWYRPSIADRLLNPSHQLDVLIVGVRDEELLPERRYEIPSLQSGPSQYAVALIIIAAIAAICFPLREVLGYQTVSLLLLLVVALMPLRLGVGPVIVAAGASALVWNFLFIPPILTFAISKAVDFLMFVAYFVIAIVTGVLTARVRGRERALRNREHRAVALFTLTKGLSTARSADEVVTVAVENIRRFFEAEAVVYLSDTDGELSSKPHPASSLAADAKSFSVASWAYWNEKRAGQHTDTLPSADATYVPISGPRYPLAVLGIRKRDAKPWTVEQEALLENFLGQIASSLEREQLNELARRSLVVAESERLYQTLFDSISHEFRTPIAGILGSTERLLETGTANDETWNTELLEVRNAASRLNRLVGNLLDMTRLESGQLRPKKDWCDVGDLVRSAVKKLEEELSGHTVDIRVEPSPLLLRTDTGLLEQALVNLLHNAGVHAPKGTPVLVTASIDGERCRLTIADKGPGIPSAHAAKVFQKFYRTPGSSPGGTGLGLSIVRGFVEALGGTVALEPAPVGARFTITLPYEEPPEAA